MKQRLCGSVTCQRSAVDSVDTVGVGKRPTWCTVMSAGSCVALGSEKRWFGEKYAFAVTTCSSSGVLFVWVLVILGKRVSPKLLFLICEGRRE